MEAARRLATTSPGWHAPAGVWGASSACSGRGVRGRGARRCLRVGCAARLTITLTERRTGLSDAPKWKCPEVPRSAPSGALAPMRPAPVPLGLPATIHPTGLQAGAGATVLFDRQGAPRLRNKRARGPHGVPERDIGWHFYPTPTYTPTRAHKHSSLSVYYISYYLFIIYLHVSPRSSWRTDSIRGGPGASPG